MSTERAEYRENSITIPMSNELKHSINEAAKNAEGIGRSEYCRMVLKAATKIALPKLLMIVELAKDGKI